jgi:hypothetical protein
VPTKAKMLREKHFVAACTLNQVGKLKELQAKEGQTQQAGNASR